MEEVMATQAKNGSELQQAIALLIHNQAAFVRQMNAMAKDQVEMAKHRVESERRMAMYQVESDRRFARIESELEQIKAILLRHDRVLADLPEAIRQKVGFKTGR
jgi:xanthine dehydrogenase iron-sulfur cluster and FAD-binding subunit A